MYGTTTRSNELMAIADSKLSVYRVDEKLKLNIKNSIYELKDIIYFLLSAFITGMNTNAAEMTSGRIIGPSIRSAVVSTM